MDENTQLKNKVRELEDRLAKMERLFTITPTMTTMNTNVRITGTVHADRLYRRGTSTYSEVTT